MTVAGVTSGGLQLWRLVPIEIIEKAKMITLPEK